MEMVEYVWQQYGFAAVLSLAALLLAGYVGYRHLKLERRQDQDDGAIDRIAQALEDAKDARTREFESLRTAVVDGFKKVSDQVKELHEKDEQNFKELAQEDSKLGQRIAAVEAVQKRNGQH